MELKFNDVVLAMFSDEPLEDAIPLEKVMEVYRAFSNGGAKFVGFVRPDDFSLGIVTIDDYGVGCSVYGVRAEVVDDVLYLFGNLLFTKADEDTNVRETLEKSPWRIILHAENRNPLMKTLDREVVLEYAVKQLETERLV